MDPIPIRGRPARGKIGILLEWQKLTSDTISRNGLKTTL